MGTPGSAAHPAVGRSPVCEASESKAVLRGRHSQVCGIPQALCPPHTRTFCVCYSPPFPRSDSFKHLGEIEERVPDRRCLSAGLLI